MINILNLFFQRESISFFIFALSLTSALGLFIGNIKIFKINIGIAGVLFSGILLSYLGLKPNEKILEFTREFGLILFVYAVGTEVGPGFFSSFKKDGFKLNIMATFVILIGFFMAIGIFKFLKIDVATTIGMYCGAVTNTPSLASAQQTVLNTINANQVNDISVGYALAYPGAIIAIILSIIIIKIFFKKEVDEELEEALKPNNKSQIENLSIEVENKNLEGIKIKDIPAIDSLNIVVSRIYKNGNLNIAHDEDILSLGDIILAVGLKENLDNFTKIIGKKSDINLTNIPGKIIHSRVVITKKNVIGKTLLQSKILSYNVVVTRISRADVEFIASDDYIINYGDNLFLVGEKADVEKVSKILGNSPKDLIHPQLLPIFIGIIVGVIIGSIPFNIPGFSKPLKLGLAGGPLIAAIFFSYIQNIGRITWYIPPPANLMLREIGIILFLSSVGLKSGDSFFQMLLYGNGLKISLLSFLISLLPLLIMGFFMKIKYKTSFLSLSGALAGSMTDPPALAFSNSLSSSNMASISYASVYPWVMFLRIISAQILVLFFLG